MTGIYLITNKIDGKCYVGQSVDIERRVMEHKTPKATGNEKLHSDMQRLGKENFEFSILELCKKEDLRARELHFIKELNPYYNTVGKTVSQETRNKISNAMKKRWKEMPESDRERIICNNLTGPRKGHEVTAETRAKLSKWCSENQGRKVMIVETGMVFDQVKQMEAYLGACTGTYAAYRSGKIKTVKGYHVVECRD